MKRLILLVVFSSSYFLHSVQAQMPDSVGQFIDSALNIMEQHSIYAKRLNWKKVRDTVFILAASAKKYNETAPALQYAFNLLGDKHGWLVMNDVEYRNPAFKPDTSRISDDIKKAAAHGPKVYTAIEDNKYAYLSIPFFGGQTNKQMNDFAQRLQDSLCKVTTSQTKGFIIDLRLNAGGNMFPMLAGISNLVGNGIVFDSKDSKGNSTGKTELVNYGITIIDTLVTQLKTNCGDLSDYPVAVIIGPVTGSAGECLAIGLRGRKKTKLFGETTAGYTSSNQGYLLPGENNGIVIGVDFLHDRNGKEYSENVQPDLTVIGGDAFFDHARDKKIIAAIRWLKRRP